MAYLFWAGLALLVYTYLGYGLVAWLGAKWAQSRRKKTAAGTDWPEVTLLVAAYNEEDFIEAKIKNSLALDYPEGKLKCLFVTDGSTDRTNEIIRRYPEVTLLYEPARRGKIAAVDRAMEQVDTPITVLTDANAMLNREAVRRMAVHFRDPQIGAVAGEKRVKSAGAANAKGESLYWRYESTLKKLDFQWYSVVGAAGELYAVRTRLFQKVPPDTLLDDFMQTLLIARSGYRVAYAHDAYAVEGASADTREEMKRKVRICAGGIQSIVRLGDLINPLRYGVLSIQYLSHRVFRWTLAPLALVIVLLTNIVLAWNGSPLYQVLLAGQLLFYGLALAGYLRQDRPGLFPGFFVPFYFAVMNVSAYLGFARYLRGRQSVNWERAKRVDEKAGSSV